MRKRYQRTKGGATVNALFQKLTKRQQEEVLEQLIQDALYSLRSHPHGEEGLFNLLQSLRSYREALRALNPASSAAIAPSCTILSADFL